jgi:hypothetical protein
VKTPLLAGATVLAALAWTVALLVDGTPFQTASVLLIGLGLASMATVAMVGMVVVGGRWAHRLGLAVIVVTAALAVVRPTDVAWVVATLTSALALGALLSPALLSTIRGLPSASGPPPRAVAPALLLLATPCLLGLAGADATSWALLVVGISAPVAAFVYSRVLPGGLLAVRLVWPALAIGLSPLLGWWAGVLTVVIAVVVAAISWGSSVKASYHPPLETGTALPIPPELAPREVLDAAQIDDTGRPL